MMVDVVVDRWGGIYVSVGYSLLNWRVSTKNEENTIVIRQLNISDSGRIVNSTALSIRMYNCITPASH